jgi:hypothetical protein
MPLLKPTKKLVEKYRREFEDENRAGEEAISEILKLFPNNEDYKGVLLKCIVINALYYTQIRAITNAAKRIMELNIDTALQRGDAQLVDRIAELTITTKGGEEKKRRNYSFATKYCSLHQPDLYPIYDNIVDKTLKAYQRQEPFSSQPFGDLKDYRRFKQVLKEFVNYYDLRGLGFRALDCFVHDYGKEALDKLANGTL